ncbi:MULTISPECIES: pathogenesis-related BetVI family protein [Bacteria]|uniref:pathogenesis-related BetVI family protein n=1 Tax=Bacteria TaxID=2 RepID=UPI0013620021|nr:MULTISPECIES: pathogenesis-related BetVI family protein [Bacteria]
MGVTTFVQELKTKVTSSRLFKALVTEAGDVIPKASPSIKSMELVHGDTYAPGSIIQTNFPEGAHFKYVQHRIDEIDQEKHTIKYTLVEGDVLGEKLEKICYDMKFEDTADGGCVVKVTSEYHTKGDFEVKEEDLKAGKEHSLGMYKACEEYLIANPHVCA